MTRRPLALLAVGCLLLSACSSSTPAAESTTAPSAAASAASPAGGGWLQQLGVDQSDAVAVIEAMEASSTPRPVDMKASVRYDKLVLADEQGERELPIRNGKFYLSIAPYVDQTHECFAHSLSGCQGEQTGKPVHVTITDAQGATLVDTDATTHSNGFVGFWLPRDISGKVTVTLDGRTGTVPFSTTADSPTCLTTLQVA
ncbi:CueP family metal-binding protein [Luteococcus peritonei]|uniref:CueP family metal-binding protein n=1 Tax=Luteococcus peritonei TaxID=88874 RepID=A0ABW4RTQ3_9ACTN